MRQVVRLALAMSVAAGIGIGAQAPQGGEPQEEHSPRAGRRREDAARRTVRTSIPAAEPASEPAAAGQLHKPGCPKARSCAVALTSIAIYRSSSQGLQPAMSMTWLPEARARHERGGSSESCAMGLDPTRWPAHRKSKAASGLMDVVIHPRVARTLVYSRPTSRWR